MTKFEMFGINAQNEARTKAEAIKAFKWSCKCCCMRGMRLDCDRCQISYVHDQTIACIDAMEKIDAEINEKKAAASKEVPEKEPVVV